jgi:flavine halogenase
MASATRPARTQILVIGGGPAGSYTAAVLAREGHDVSLFEQAKFPRYHIGESLLASCNEFFNFLDVRKKMDAHGFVRKVRISILRGAK